MTLRNLTTTLEEGLIRTWRLPRRSALTMLLRQSFCAKSLTWSRKERAGTYEDRYSDHFELLLILFSLITREKNGVPVNQSEGRPTESASHTRRGAFTLRR